VTQKNAVGLCFYRKMDQKDGSMFLPFPLKQNASYEAPYYKILQQNEPSA